MRKAVKSKKRVSTPSRRNKTSFTFQRLVIITSCVLLVLGIVTLKKNSVTQSVAGVSIARGLFAQATVSWTKNDIASTYNIYYRQKGDTRFTNAVRKIPSSVTNYNISYLKKGVNYEYKISAADLNGREFSWSEVKQMTNLKPM